ncbi:MAG: hypothetical protein HY575_04910 [candidate division NC10 bacterium]|nr:hypothetical protein [candidate division NC10 bacterium]
MQRSSTAVTAQHLLRRLRADERRGARALALLGARVLARLLAEPGGSGWEARLARGTAALLRGQAAMAPLLVLANAVWLALERPGAPSARRAAALVALAGARARLEEAPARVAAAAVRLHRTARTVVTISNSSTVLAALTGLAARRPLRVIVGEGRPALEGRGLARWAARVGCRVTLVPDAALPGEVGGADAVLVGADALVGSAAINKVGTYPLVLAARHARVPASLLADRSKCVPKALTPLLRLTPRDPRSLWASPPSGVAVARTDFERVPLSLVTAVVTEDGPTSPQALVRRLAALPASRLLRRWVRQGPPGGQRRAGAGRR